MQTVRKRNDKTRTDFLVDAAIFLAFLIAMDPRSSGIAIHEWLSIAFAAAAIVHLLHWNWIAATTRKLLGRVPRQARVNYILNILLFIDVTLIMFTGVMISEAALPALGIRMQPDFLWRRLHSVTADLSLILLGLHLATHWRWIVATIKRYVFGFSLRPRKAARVSVPASATVPVRMEDDRR
jgi:hypothetical protein